jgi:hypothetical protein
MNNFILISQTYSEPTPESCENGDFSDTGFIDECKRVTFTELVDLMGEHMHPSQSPNDGNTNVWYSTDMYTKNYYKGIEREESIHYHRNNTVNAAKYWKLARIIADQKSINYCNVHKFKQ